MPKAAATAQQPERRKMKHKHSNNRTRSAAIMSNLKTSIETLKISACIHQAPLETLDEETVLW